ncbi:hypothetical protein FACS1894182_12380 [Bacteroidia bacterium]|nr:hypothetical protein FACS1894182_12380 [Bacteroidia bacterium]
MRKNESYIPPIVKVIEVKVEQGFAQSVEIESSSLLIEESERTSDNESTSYWF